MDSISSTSFADEKSASIYVLPIIFLDSTFVVEPPANLGRLEAGEPTQQVEIFHPSFPLSSFPPPFYKDSVLEYVTTTYYGYLLLPT